MAGYTLHTLMLCEVRFIVNRRACLWQLRASNPNTRAAVRLGTSRVHLTRGSFKSINHFQVGYGNITFVISGRRSVMRYAHLIRAFPSTKCAAAMGLHDPHHTGMELTEGHGCAMDELREEYMAA